MEIRTVTVADADMLTMKETRFREGFYQATGCGRAKLKVKIIEGRGNPALEFSLDAKDQKTMDQAIKFIRDKVTALQGAWRERQKDKVHKRRSIYTAENCFTHEGVASMA